MKRQLMAESWDDFARSVFHDNIPEIQRREMRRAFYAGAHAILFKVIDSLAPESEPTAEDLDIMSNLHNELLEFATAVAEGRA
jgi:hypothetical protein